MRQTTITRFWTWLAVAFPFSTLPVVGQQSPGAPADFQAYVVSHTHSDFAWADSMAGCLDKNVAAVAKSVELAEQYPDFRFCMEHMLAVREYLKRNPEKLETLQRLMREGRFEAGGFYTGPWELTCGAEGLVRELYLGKRWVKQTLGFDPVTVWNVDVAGHTAQLPQILQKAGIKGFVISAGASGPALFRWQARDGSSVLTWSTPWGYSASAALGLRDKDLAKAGEKMPQFIRDVARNCADFQLPHIALIADGTDIQSPSGQVVENIRRWNAETRLPPLTYSSSAALFAAVEKNSLPSFAGEMPAPWDTVQSQGNECFMPDRQLDGRLLAAEKLAAFCSVLVPSYRYPQDDFGAAWENRLYAMDHNWGGWHGAENDQLKAEKIQAAGRSTDAVLKDAFTALADAIKFKQASRDATPIILFNPLSWDRKDVVTCELPISPEEAGALKIVDSRGKTVAFQIAEDDASARVTKVTFCAEVPSLGYTTFYACQTAKPKSPGSGSRFRVDLAGQTFENDFFRLQLDRPSGGIKSLYDKKSRRELVRQNDKYVCNELLALEDDDVDIGTHLTGRQWLGREHSSAVRVAENGPVRLVIEVTGGLLQGSKRTQQIILYADLPRVDLLTRLDWEGQRNVQLYQVFPLNVPEPRVRYAVPYGWEEYGQEMKFAAPWFERVQPPVAKHNSRGVRGWIELADGANTVTLASQCNYAAFKDLSTNAEPGFLIQPLLLRTVRSCGDDGRLYYEQKGAHDFRFSLAAQADPTHLGEELDSPLLSFVASPRAGVSARLPERWSFLRVEHGNVHVAAVKRAEDGNGLIVRLVEMKERSRSTDTLLQAFRPVQSAARTSIIEEDETAIAPVKGRVAVRLAPAGIETLRIGFEQNPKARADAGR